MKLPASATPPSAGVDTGPQSRPEAHVTPRIVIFDLGEVLATPPGLYRSLAACLSRQPDVVEAAYWAHRDAYDRGGTAHAFWSAVLAELGRPAAPGTVSELTRIDTEAWTTIRPDALSLLKTLSERDVRVGILSNATLEMATAARKTSWAPYITDWFFSSELHLAKPDPALYRHVTTELGLPAGTIVFVDDRRVNVDAALKSGWNACLWTSGDDTAALLTGLGLLAAE
ncbi:putative hydrolase of the HAD superfamily [Streptomyces sp. LBL]|uniref:HAD family hydrolase n=1 Tax=Streptomyces sp. LBL TaxID=2940562 RepID=UPI0024749D9C|nr:HAD family phosphatase [Streptomyces sp. LBL]MDH6622261.1 putative hydrolase of the HAD superfamily [Streptomyces sp. LBL]